MRLAFLSKRAALRLRVPALRDEIMTGDAHSLDTAARLLPPRCLFPNSWGIPDLLDYGSRILRFLGLNQILCLWNILHSLSSVLLLSHSGQDLAVC